MSSLWGASEHGEIKIFKKLFTSIKKKKERRAALVTGKMPKLGNSYIDYILLQEACYEACLPILILFIELDKK